MQEILLGSQDKVLESEDETTQRKDRIDFLESEVNRRSVIIKQLEEMDSLDDDHYDNSWRVWIMGVMLDRDEHSMYYYNAF